MQMRIQSVSSFHLNSFTHRASSEYNASVMLDGNVSKLADSSTKAPQSQKDPK